MGAVFASSIFMTRCSNSFVKGVLRSTTLLIGGDQWVSDISGSGPVLTPTSERMMYHLADIALVVLTHVDV